MSSDLPYYETLYGVYLQDLTYSYGAGQFVDTNYILTKDYYDEGDMTTDYTTLAAGSNTIKFLYPHWIKKQYYIEGVIEGQFTLSCLNDYDTLISYEVKVMKVDDTGFTDQIGTTGVKIPSNLSFTWYSNYNVGTEIVYPFSIEVSPEKKMLDKERIYVEITIVATSDFLIFYHTNDATWQDLKIAIPFRGL